MAVPTKTPRLLAAAKEFNIGRDTLVNFLKSKGFDTDDFKPNTRLTEEMYESLQDEFQQDRANKRKSDQIDLPRGVSVGSAKEEHREEKTDQEKKEEAPQEDVLVDTKAEGPGDLSTGETETSQPLEQTPAPEGPPVDDLPPSVKEDTPSEAEPLPEQAAEESTPHPEAEVPASGTTAPEQREEAREAEKPKTTNGVNVVGKIDLSGIDSSTRPKKTAKKKDTAKETDGPTEEKEETTIQQPEMPPKKESEEAKKVEKEQPVEKETQESEEPERIQTKTIRLSGPRLVGKIDLPKEPVKKEKEKEKEKEKSTREHKRKRKRIPLDRKNAGAGTRSPKKGAGRPSGKGRRGRQVPEKEIDEKEIQEKIRETQAKLSGTSRNKSLKAKNRRAKREEKAEQRAASEAQENNKLQVTEFISVNEFASLMDVSFADVISKCMSLGIMVSINQRLDAEVIELVASEFGYEVEFIDLKEQEELMDKEEQDDPGDLKPRSPIVTIMGHVDHGKTSLLDYIRNAAVVAGEVGGITQHIGAYEVTLPEGKKICFLDTPGHEAFTAMRARGATVGDIAVIVIAADDAIMPQTKEAISHAQAAGLPMIFAINKIDKEGANPEKIKEQLAAMNILVEDWGGKFQSQEISAKKGTHVDQLLEKILLEAELLELKANPDRHAVGTVIDASLDKGRGYVTSLLVQNGTLTQGDMIVAGPYYGRMKALFNERGQRIEKSTPSTPVQVLGLNGAPQSGEKFRVFENESDAKELASHRTQIMREQSARARKHITLEEIGRRLALGNFKELNVIIKGDVDGSVEALSDSFQKLSTEEIVVNVVHKAVGQITESDVLLATASDAIIVGFQVRPSVQAARLAENENIEIRTYSIIYTAIEELKSAMEGMLEPKIEEKVAANVEVRETYRINKVAIAGCYVQDGKINRNSRIHLIRDGIVIYTGELGSLKRYKEDAREITAGMECGLTIKNYNDIKIGDIIEAYDEIEVKRTL